MSFLTSDQSSSNNHNNINQPKVWENFLQSTTKQLQQRKNPSTSNNNLDMMNNHNQQQQQLQQQKMKSTGAMTNHQKLKLSENKYQLQHSVSELFRLLNVCEGKDFTREKIAEKFEENLGRQSSKPYSLFYNRLADNQNFVEKYQKLKCQNANEVDPFVRFLVRVREDKNTSVFLNNYRDIMNGKESAPSQDHVVVDSSNHRSFVSLSRSSTTPSVLATAMPKTTQFFQQKPTTSQTVKPRPTSMLLQSSQTMTNVPGLSQIPMPTTTTTKTSTNRMMNTPSNTKLYRRHHTALVASPSAGTDLNDLNESFRSVVTNSSQSAINNPHNISSSSSIATNSTQQQQQTRKIPPYLSRDFHPCEWPKENDCFNTLGKHSVAEQEQLLLRDLLFVLIGIEGRFIRLVKTPESCHYKLVLDSTTDHFLAVTTNRILKICYSYSNIITFVETRVYGLVNQALVASIQQHLNDYNMLICQMEDMLLRNDLFLQKMFFMLLPYFSTFSLLRDLCMKLHKNKSVGGSVLTLLHEKTKSIQGMDNNALELCLTLTKSSSIPYFDIMKTWIYYGEIDDPRREFFIEDEHQQQALAGQANGTHHHHHVPNNQQAHNSDDDDEDEYDDDFGKFNDKYWDVRYRVNSSKTPCFLKKHELIIYKTGKYVSIINKVKQLFMKSSKVIPVSQLISQNQNFPTPPFSSNLEFLSANNSTAPNHHHQMINFLTNNNFNNMIESSAVSTNSAGSSSNASSSGGNRSATTPAPSTVIFTPRPEPINYSFDESTYLSPILSAYEEASSQLLHLLIHESQLVETFNAVKHYMLASMGDFVVHFMKFASKDLCKRTDSVVQHRLDSMMGMALGISVCPTDRQFLKDDPHIEFVGKSFLKQIYQIMKPLDLDDMSFANDPSPSSSYLMRCDQDDEEDDDDDDVNLNRSIIGSVIEGDSPDGSGVKIRSSTKYADPSSSSNRHQQNKKYLNDSKDSNSKKSQNNLNKLYCYESLMLKFDVPFPLSLIFTQKSIVCYELLFRYLFLCRYAEMELEETWKDNILNVELKRWTNNQLNEIAQNVEHSNGVGEMLTKAFKSIHKKAFALRYKMIAFMRNFHYFYAFEVIAPSFTHFIEQITKRGSSLDSVIECHEKFLEHCFSSCFLTSIEITTIIIKIFTLCIELSHALKDSIDVDEQSSIMESSCFFGDGHRQANDHLDGMIGTEKSKTSSSPFEPFIRDQLNKIYFGQRRQCTVNNNGSMTSIVKQSQRGPSAIAVKEIIEKANFKFDGLVSRLLKRIFSDNCEYHMMYPFVARLDYNDFYRSRINE